MKKKKWHFLVILSVLAITLYNILPTLFFYAHSLDKPVNGKDASQIARQITRRLSGQEKETLSWTKGLLDLSGLRVKAINSIANRAQDIEVVFENTEKAHSFAYQASRAGSMRPFDPAKVIVTAVEPVGSGAKVILHRAVGGEIQEGQESAFFGFCPKKLDHNPNAAYSQIAMDRLGQIVSRFVNTSQESTFLQVASQNPETQLLCLNIAEKILDYEKYFRGTAVAKRYYGSFTHGSGGNAAPLLEGAFERQTDVIKKRIAKLEREKPKDLDSRVKTLKAKVQVFSDALGVVKKNAVHFSSEEGPASLKKVHSDLQNVSNGVFFYDLKNRDPFIKKARASLVEGKLEFILHDDVKALIGKNVEGSQILKGKIAKRLIQLGHETGEEICEKEGTFFIALNKASQTHGLLTLDLRRVAKSKLNSLEKMLKARWHPKSEALQDSEIIAYPQYVQRGRPDNFRGLILCAPVLDDELPFTLERGSLFVIARGLEPLLSVARKDKESETSKVLFEDMGQLQNVLNGEMPTYQYSSREVALPKEFHGDYFFESPHYYAPLLQATREPFYVVGSKKLALLELGTVGDRLQAINQIETEEHAELVRLRDDYLAAQVDLDKSKRLLAPKPSKSTFWSNFLLSARKYVRGDVRKTLRWALDLSGGKSVRIELVDRQNRLVKGEEDLNQAVNELYKRVNKLGVSEVSIRREGAGIRLDFPGAQKLSAKDLITGSTMTFHMVNENFSRGHVKTGPLVDQFLSEVWSEAFLSGRTDARSLHEIAWHKFGGAHEGSGALSQAAKELKAQGLRLVNPNHLLSSNDCNNQFSMIGRVSGKGPKEWGHSHPLMVLFANYALEGSDLEDAQASYHPERGHFLTFKVKSAYQSKGGKTLDPRGAFYTWTSQYAKAALKRASLSEASVRDGWHMAIVLNDEVISAPSLNEPLRDGGSITGNFSQREVEKLESDLRAGSLSFKPRILSETNVSPELGQNERTWGIAATFMALLGVIAIMVGFYRLGGLVASICVIFNLLIMWAAFQNLGAALSLANIAGVVLTIGMAVDANVLVFERIREEFEKSKNISTALKAGYQRAFTAIFDSNLTTAVAALVLLNFDSGPVKGFALALIIGIASSMFTALFVSRFFLTCLVEKGRITRLNMATLFTKMHFNFFRGSKRFIALVILMGALGIGAWSYVRKDMLGMDFTGGYSFQIELSSKGKTGRSALADLFTKLGVNNSDFQIREGASKTSLRATLSSHLDDAEALFAGMHGGEEKASFIHAALLKDGFVLSENGYDALKNSWVEVSGQLSDVMRIQAVLGLVIALGCILIYISVRFEPAGALSAIFCLVHDVLITLGSLAILRFLGLDIRIDLHTIAALLTIVGYSLNDTIIIFDRLREERKLYPREPLKALITRSLNVTLTRTFMTSATTLVVLLFLVIFGGGALFSFALVMTIGVFLGTLSSLFLSGPLLIGFIRLLGRKKEISGRI